MRDDRSLNNRDVHDVKQYDGGVMQEASFPQNRDACQSQSKQRYLRDQVQKCRLVPLAEKPEVEKEVLRGASGENLGVAAVLGRGTTEQSLVERNFVLRSVEQLVVGAHGR